GRRREWAVCVLKLSVIRIAIEAAGNEMAEFARGNPFALVVAEKNFTVWPDAPAERIAKTEGDFFDARFFCAGPKPQQRARADQVLIRVRGEREQKRTTRLANQTVAPVVAVTNRVRKSSYTIKSVRAPVAI